MIRTRLRLLRSGADRVRALLSGLIAVSALVVVPALAWGDVPVVYHSPNDDGVPLVEPLDVLPGSSNTLYLYIDGGSEGSSEIRCATGTGDETCFWNVVLQGAATVTINDFTPNAGIIHYLDPTGASIGINGGDPWRGDLGPRRIGEMVIDGGAYGGALELASGESVNSSLGVDSMAPVNIVPEPTTGLSLGFGGVLLGVLGRRRARTTRQVRFAQRSAHHPSRRGRIVPSALFVAMVLVTSIVPQAQAQLSTDCGDVVADGTVDASDLDALRRFLVGDPSASDLQGDPTGLARCDVTGDGVCGVGDYVRIRRYMIDLTGGLNETCPLAGATYPSVVLAAPVVDQPSAISTDRSSILLTGTAEPGELVRVEGAPSLPFAAAEDDGTWAVEVPLVLDAVNALGVRRDFGGGYLSESSPLSVTQTDATGTSGIEGIVFDAASETPIAGATVSVHGVATATDTFGRFVLDGLPEGSAVVRVESTGYVPVAISTAADSIPFSTAGALSSGALEVALTPMAATQTIGTAGGTLTTPLGFELVVPAGSLAADTEIALTELLGRGSSSLTGIPAVDIGPGPITFDPPAILRLPISGLDPGLPADLVQVDQVAGTAAPRVGTTNGTGVIEIEVHSSVGDGIEPVFGAYKREAVFPQGKEGVPIGGREFAFDNCNSQQLKVETIDPASRAILFTGDPLGGANPLLRAQLEADPRPLVEKTKGLIEAIPSASETVVVPPGTRGILIADGRSVTIEQPIYAIRYGGGGDLKKRLGTLRYEVGIPQTFIIDRVDDCPKPKGGAWGDPHLIRFDHVGSSQIPSNGNGRFDFQAGGEFVLFESTVDAMTVQARFEALSASPSVSVTKAAAFDLDGDRVMVDIDASALRVRVGGVVTVLTAGAPIVLPGGGELERLAPASGQDLVVARWIDGSSLTINLSSSPDEHLNLYPELAASRLGAVQGLLGNANGILGDDFNLRDGTPADPSDLHTVYSNSWRISQAESLFDYEPGEDTTTYNSVPPDTEFTLDDLDPVDRAAAESICISAGIDEDPLFSECALDVALLSGAATGGALETLDQIPDVGTYVAILAEGNIFQAGQSSVVDFGGGGGAGLLPTEVPLDPGTGRWMRVLDRAGDVSFSAGSSPMPLDGVDYGPVAWGSWGAVAGPELRRLGQLMGVFLDSGLPSPVPSSYDCGDFQGEFAAPELGQVFCIGDGLSFANEPQTFFVPDAATRLFLGHAERLSSQVVESAVHHLGDNFGTGGLFALDPNPEGPSFISSGFDLPTGFTPSSGRVLVDLAETSIGGNSVWVNGQFMSYLPVTGASGTTWTEDVAFTVDPSVLLPTGNWIELRSTGGNLDDYLFKDLRFEVAPPLTVLPVPSDTTPYHLGCNCGQFIGDGVGAGNWGLYALMPTPYGTSWTSPPFSVEDPEALGGASVVIDIAQTDRGNNPVLVNGTVVGTLPIRPDGTVWSADEEIDFDPGLLRETGNTIEIRSGYLVAGLGEVDDFMMRDVRIAVAREAEVPPGGYSDNTGFQELIIEVSP